MDEEKILSVSEENYKFGIIGLGNPGSVYSGTRHNIGFMVLDKLYDNLNARTFHEKVNYMIAHTKYQNKKIDLLKPVTFMNLSGLAVKEYLEETILPYDNLLVIYDDVNLDFGTLRIRAKGSDGGHKGLHSIIYETGTEKIARLRIGIRNEELLGLYKKNINYDLADYVLSGFTESEQQSLNNIIIAAFDAVICFITNGIKQAMNLFNKNILVS